MLSPMEDLRLGALVRLVRRARGWRQVDLAAAAHVSDSLVSLVERGHLDALSLRRLRRTLAVLDIRVDVLGRWRGGDSDRLLNSGHSALHESMARFFSTLAGWVALPEVSFNVYGDRGVIDILAWFPQRRFLLVIELKTELVDVQALLGTVDKYRRLAATVARDRGWNPVSTSVWVVLTDTTTNRRRVAEHRTVLRSVLPADGRTMRSWLRDPGDPIAALSFWSDSNPGGLGRPRPAKHRVLRPTSRSTTHGAASTGASTTVEKRPSPRAVESGG
jgi:transcriptional regulator with XRE-family HTH domain